MWTRPLPGWMTLSKSLSLAHPCALKKRKCHTNLSGVVPDCRRKSILRAVKCLHLKAFVMFISLCLGSKRIKSAYALGSVSMGRPWPPWVFVHQYSKGLGLRASEHPEPWLLVCPAVVKLGAGRGLRVRSGGFQLLSKATWAAVPSPLIPLP